MPAGCAALTLVVMKHQPAHVLRRPAVLDIAAAAVLVALTLLFAWRLITPGGADPKLIHSFGSAAAWHWHLLVWWLASVAALSVLPLRHRWPAAVVLVTVAVFLVHCEVLAFPPLPVDLAVALAAYSLAAARPRRVSLPVLAGSAVLAMIADAGLGGAWSSRFFGGGWLGVPADAIMAGVIAAAAWLAGDGARTRRAYLAEVERRASDAERDRDRQAELAAAAERSRITRELHDVIAHALSVIVIQAQGGGAALRLRHPDQAGTAFGAIITTGRGALAETRRLLGVVRRDPADDLELAPQPALDRLSELVGQVRRAGTPVDLCVEGEPRPLAAGVELSAYRIIQEGLTNTIKHGGPGAAATVRVSYRAADIWVEVTDNGRGLDGRDPELPPGGHGLRGMQTRVGMLGGELDAGPLAGSGFRVRARLPLRDPAGEPPQIPAGEPPQIPAGEPARGSADRLAAGPSGNPAPGQAGR
jgi:signal transduction histidine kinase